jgi:calreticulin
MCLQQPLIDNPDFEDDEEVYLLPPIKFVGFELWQVKSGTIFDNILLTDSTQTAANMVEDIAKRQVIEMEMYNAIQEEQNRAIEVCYKNSHGP